MKKQFIPYELALKLKELGFDEECLGYYNQDAGEQNTVVFKKCKNNNLYKYSHVAPLWQQAFDWFREKHNLIIQPLPIWNNEEQPVDFFKDKPKFYITDGFIYYDNKSVENSDKYNTFVEARQACLEQLIEIVTKRNFLVVLD